MALAQSLILLLTMQSVPIKGMTYVSWQAGEYPYTTAWKAQGYWNSQAVKSVWVDTFQGRGVLGMSVHLDPDNDSLRSGETYVDMRYFPPLCASPPPPDTVIPIDLRNKVVECSVYCPRGCGTPSRPSGLQMFVKDRYWSSWYSEWVNIGSGRDSWYHLYDTVPASAEFDPAHIISVGVKVGLNSTRPDSGFTDTMYLANFNWKNGSEPKYAFEHTGNALDSLEAVNCNYVALINTWYMDSWRSNTIRRAEGFTHHDTDIVRTIREIERHDMKVMLKPHVDVGIPPDDTVWRGYISPLSVPAWFDSYRELIVHNANLVKDESIVGLFCIGTELQSMDTTHREYWLDIIDTVRKIIDTSRCKLTYAANWDLYELVSFWDSLDYVGIDAYFPLSPGRPDPPLDSIIAGWQPHIQSISNWQRQVGKPILFTEIGYPSRTGAAAQPWARPNGAIFQVNCSLQAACYAAAIIAWDDTTWFAGRFWWHWTPVVDAGGWWDDHFTPQNKPAADTLRKYWDGVVEFRGDKDPPRAPFVFPTPSYRSVSINHSVASTSEVAIQVSDATGRQVCSLGRYSWKPGPHRVEWHGCDDSGRLLPSGIYFVSISEAGRTRTSRAVLCH